MYCLDRDGNDGKTPWLRETGRIYAKAAFQFGEKIMMREARERVGTAKRDWEPRLILVRYMGHHARTGSIVGLTEEGVTFGESAKRLPVEDRWALEGWDKLRGLPWDLKPKEREAPLDCQDDQAPVLLQRPVPPEVTREFYVRRTDVEQYGPTPGCERCRTIAERLPPKGTHTPECRERMKEHVRDVEQERFSKFEEKQIGEALRQQVRAEEKKNVEQEKAKREKKDAEEAVRQDLEGGSSSSAGEPEQPPATRRKVQFADEEQSASAGSSADPKPSEARLRPKRPMWADEDVNEGEVDGSTAKAQKREEDPPAGQKR